MIGNPTNKKEEAIFQENGRIAKQKKKSQLGYLEHGNGRDAKSQIKKQYLGSKRNSDINIDREEPE